MLENDIKDYAGECLHLIKKEFPQLAGAQLPKFKLYESYQQIKYADGSRDIVQGYTATGGRTICIYGTDQLEPEALKQIIRHELIHAVLAQTGRPHSDTDPLFILMAIRYNARPDVLPAIIEDRPAPGLTEQRRQEIKEIIANLEGTNDADTHNGSY